MRHLKKLLAAILKKALFVFALAFIAIQFIRPSRNSNISGKVFSADISNSYFIPENLYALLLNSCYDCHSNNTNYPWYSYIQPINWQMESHIKKGKEKLNFSEFGDLSSRRQNSKLREIEVSINDSTMPMSVYTLMHRKARLSQEDKESLINWIELKVK